jgi:hypothetical protein
VSSKTIDNYYFDIYNAEIREDFDWQLTPNFLLSFGGEELFKKWNTVYDSNLKFDMRMDSGAYIQVDYLLPNLSNNAFFSALWAVAEWKSPSKKIDIEAGLRAQHVYFYDDQSSFSTLPDINPRFSASFTVFDDGSDGKSGGKMKNVRINLGTALFSAINDEISKVDLDTGLKELKNVSSWTSTLGALLNFKNGTELNFEGYYKYLFNRGYPIMEKVTNPDTEAIEAADVYYYDGTSHIFGFDLLLRRDMGKKLTGWLSYSFSYAKYHDGASLKTPYGAYFNAGDDGWYYPLFHRFHSLNIVLNYAITKKYNLYLRSGFVSGSPDSDKSIYSYKVTLEDGQIIDKYGLAEYYSNYKRKMFKLPFDIKLSYLFFNKSGKTQGEVYIAIENALVLAMPRDDSKVLNPYTGKMESGANGAIYDLPIPMVSFGFKWSY